MTMMATVSARSRLRFHDSLNSAFASYFFYAAAERRMEMSKDCLLLISTEKIDLI